MLRPGTHEKKKKKAGRKISLEKATKIRED